MQKVTAYINIGSNMGDRPANLSRAVALISELSGGGVTSVSDVVESEPWGYVSDHMFLNVGVLLDTVLEPEVLLDLLQRVERALWPVAHRDSAGAYVDREVDVDLITYGDEVIDTARLKVPHPFMAERRFVLLPLVQLMPEWKHPLTGLTARDMLARLG